MNATDTPSPAMVRRVVLASIVGNAFEWFDFAIYGLFAGIIAKQYFPRDNALASLMLALATFGVGFAVRPIGGVMLGVYGDRVGRKKALSLTIGMMAIGTGMIGLLPPYGAIGVFAPLLLLIARLLQGISAGGEFGGATTMLIEFAPVSRRGLYGSFQMCSQALAFAIGAAVAWLLVTRLSNSALELWGWRVPFILGILVGPLGWFIRSRVDESPQFAAYRRNAGLSIGVSQPMPFWTLVKDQKRQIAASTGVCVAGTVSAYIFVFFLPIMARQQFGISAGDVNLCTLAGTVVILLVCPMAGYLSDRAGRKQVLILAMLFYGLVSFLMFRQFVAAPSFRTLFQLQLGVSFAMSFLWGPVPIALTEGFPVGVRSTGAALAYNIAVLLFGGLAPAVNTWLVKTTGSNLAPMYYVLLSIAIGLAGAALLPGRAKLSEASNSVRSIV